MNIILSQNNSVTEERRAERRAVTSLRRSNMHLKGKISSKRKFMCKTYSAGA